MWGGGGVGHGVCFCIVVYSHVCMKSCLHRCIYVCMFVRVYVYLFVRTRLFCSYTFVCLFDLFVCLFDLYVCQSVGLSVCTCAHKYVCINVWMQLCMYNVSMCG